MAQVEFTIIGKGNPLTCRFDMDSAFLLCIILFVREKARDEHLLLFFLQNGEMADILFKNLQDSPVARADFVLSCLKAWQVFDVRIVS